MNSNIYNNSNANMYNFHTNRLFTSYELIGPLYFAAQKCRYEN